MCSLLRTVALTQLPSCWHSHSLAPLHLLSLPLLSLPLLPHSCPVPRLAPHRHQQHLLWLSVGIGAAALPVSLYPYHPNCLCSHHVVCTLTCSLFMLLTTAQQRLHREPPRRPGTHGNALQRLHLTIGRCDTCCMAINHHCAPQLCPLVQLLIAACSSYSESILACACLR